jgi:hypothetical protein
VKGFQVYALKERCAIDACVRVGIEKNLHTRSLLLANAIKAFQLSCATPWQPLNSAERGRPFENLFVSSLIEYYNGKRLDQIVFLKHVKKNRGDSEFLQKVDFVVEKPGGTIKFHGFGDTRDYFTRLREAKDSNDRETMKKLVGIAISPENSFHSDAIVVLMVNQEPGTEEIPIELVLLSFSFKIGHKIDARSSILSTALDLSYVSNYVEIAQNKKKKSLFGGMLFYLHYLPIAQQKKLSKKIKKHGGQIEADLSKSTHCVVTKTCKEELPQGKYLVTAAWVTDSVKERDIQEDERYFHEASLQQEDFVQLFDSFQVLLAKNTDGSPRTVPLIDHMVRIHVHACISENNLDDDCVNAVHLPIQFLPTNEISTTARIEEISEVIRDKGSINLIKCSVFKEDEKNKYL